MGQSTAEPAWEAPAPQRGGGSFPSLARKASASEQVVLSWLLEVGAALTPCPSWGGLGWAESESKRNCSFLCICSFPFPLSFGFPQWGNLSASLFPQFVCNHLCLPRVSESQPVSGHGSVHPCGLSPASFLEAFSLALVHLCQSLGLFCLNLFPGDPARSQAGMWEKGR